MNQPPDNWVIVFRSTSEYEVDIVKAMLADNSIMSETINSHDHTFDSLNVAREIGLYVHKNDLEKAIRVIKDSEIEG
ncbi:MAG: DUF2007 domain-containing protein [Flavobacteriales bacterium]